MSADQPTPLVGLTGGIATGKSTVAGLLRSYGAAVIDADVVAREVVEPGTSGLQQVVECFGPSILTPDGHLDRPEMGRLVMANDALRKALEEILHPLIRSEIAHRIRQKVDAGAPAVFVEAALLVETGSARLYPHLWVVSCSPEIQRQRLMERADCDQATADAWISSQLPLAQKEAAATRVIMNNGGLTELRRDVELAYHELKGQPPDRG